MDLSALAFGLFGWLPFACATTILLSVMRRWLTQHEQRRTHDVSQLVAHHQQQQDDLAARERAVRTRERLLDRQQAVNSLRLRSAWKRADLISSEARQLRHRCEELETELREVTADYNELVSETLKARSEAFTRKASGTAALIVGGDDEHSRPSSLPHSRPGRSPEEETRAPARWHKGSALGLVLEHDGAAREHERM
ncbi:hypothetical protein JHN59_11450 [Streptomyces sp. MBT49]|uniref:hypothetical protein n=1 Tax=unclassified Streptomyces TaxID=2593676 RepID=UPI00190AD381|nr:MULTISPECIES: hypothetical protein [unclassified Streptomyces]MBK3625450.1 hypothetical protein [Streptomyces sp. MBT49]MBK3633287.1 hypothetical protein [Streptomyces sp. MBT97]